jgi:hypothetical protein
MTATAITLRIVRRAATMMLAIGLLAAPATALGQATVTPIAESIELGPALVGETCAGPGVVGTLTGTATARGRMVETDGRFHLALTTSYEFRVDFADGSYLVESQRERFVLNSSEPRFTLGGTTQAKGTLHAADGTIIGDETVHASFRVTVVDGQAAVDFHKFRLSCT